MQAIILCGGKGTRLREVIGEKQKTMTKINNEPFLMNIIRYLKKYNVDDVIFSVGYKYEEIVDYFGNDFYDGIKIHYAKELEPLGTGGAIRNCCDYIINDNVIVLNGDTLFPIDLIQLINNHNEFNYEMSIACKKINDATRYGSIKIKKPLINNSNIIMSFDEKIENANNIINGGIYIINKKLIESIKVNTNISIEKDVIPMWIKCYKIGATVFDDDFIDIGTPKSLEEFKSRF